MPAVPHYPTDEPDPEEAPDLGDIVGDILRGGDGGHGSPSPV